MMRLRSRLLSLNGEKAVKVKIYSPANTEEVRIPFKASKTAKVVGKLAQRAPPKSSGADEAQLVSGVLVQNDFKLSLMAPEDLREYAGLTTTTVMCKQRITLSAASVHLVRWALEGTFGSIEVIKGKNDGLSNGDSKMNGNGGEEEADEEVERQPNSTFLVMGCVSVHYGDRGNVLVEWEGNTLNDGIADAVMAVLFTVETSPAAVKRMTPAFFDTIEDHTADTSIRIIQRSSTQPYGRTAKPSCRHHSRGAVLSPMHVPGSSIRTGHDSHNQTEGFG